MEKNYTTLHNISQLKNRQRRGANRKGTVAGLKGYGKWEVWIPPLPPSPLLIEQREELPSTVILSRFRRHSKSHEEQHHKKHHTEIYYSVTIR